MTKEQRRERAKAVKLFRFLTRNLTGLKHTDANQNTVTIKLAISMPDKISINSLHDDEQKEQERLIKRYSVDPVVTIDGRNLTFQVGSQTEVFDIGYRLGLLRAAYIPQPKP